MPWSGPAAQLQRTPWACPRLQHVRLRADQRKEARMTQSPPPKLSAAAYGSGEPNSAGKQVSDTVSEVMDQAQNTARQVSAQAKQGATSRLESQKERAVDSLVTVAQALRQT